MRIRYALRVLFCLSIPGLSAAAQAPAKAPYLNPSLPIPQRVHDLLGRMTIEEKFWQLFMIPGSLDDSTQDYSNGVFGLQVSPPPEAKLGALGMDSAAAAFARADAGRINEIQRYFVERTRLGIPIIPFDEAVHGLTRRGATVFPQAIALAATWDTALVEQVATAIAHETRSRGIRQVLSPVVNIASDVRWGRVEETYGEDPVLSSAMARAFVGAMERNGIIATPKHFVANVGEGGRDSYPIHLNKRILEETYFPPFRAAIGQAGARSVMTAYNSVDGSPATQNRWLLTEKLKQEWGFSGFVISDAAATGGATVLHHTEASTATATKHALEAGLDVIFQSSYEQHRPYLNAFRRGLIADFVIDSAVARVLRAKFELGLFEQPYVNVDSAAMWSGSVGHRELARQAAREAIVLLKNEGQALPLSPQIKSIAMIGVDAEDARYGDYTAPDPQGTSILEAIKARAGSRISVRYAPGPGRVAREYELVPASALESDSLGHIKRGLRGEYFDNNALSGEPRMVRTDERMNFQWTLNSPGRGIPYDWYSVRWAGTLVAPPSGVRQLGVEGNDGWRLWLDDSLVIDNWRERSFGAHLANVSLAPGSRHALRLEYHESIGNARLKLVFNKGQPDDWRASIDSAERIARASDVAVIVAGIEEGEFRDRALLGLPGHQVELIERVAATGKPVVVVLIGGSAITMNRWIGKVDGVLDAWYPGEAGGPAVVDVLFGDADPAGRLPITFPMAEGQLPLIYNHKPTGRGDDYVDLTGQPLFPFGFGLSYTSFEYSELSIAPDTMAPSGSAVVRFKVTNSGSRAGDEVSQLYVHDVLASVARPLMSLQGFARVHLEPGQSKYVVLTLGPEHLRMLDVEMDWVVEPGVFRVLVGSSSSDIRLRGMLRVK